MWNQCVYQDWFPVTESFEYWDLDSSGCVDVCEVNCAYFLYYHDEEEFCEANAPDLVVAMYDYDQDCYLSPSEFYSYPMFFSLCYYV